MERFFIIKGKNGLLYMTKIDCYNTKCPDWILDILIMILAGVILVTVIARVI